MILHSKILGGSKKNILILHGFLGSGDNWISIARKLNLLGHTVHLIDQRNHGRSFHSEKFDYNLMCEDLFNYIKHHNIDNSILIGHSMGGKTAMNFSLIHPQMYPKLVIGQKANLYAKFPVKLVSSCVLIVLSKLNLKKWSSVIFLSKPRLVARVTSCVVSASCEKVAAVPLIS